MFPMAMAIVQPLITKKGQELTVPLIMIGDGSDIVILSSYARYAADNAHKSLSWHVESARSIELLFKYKSATQDQFPSVRSMFENFTEALLHGTHENGKDKTDLWWNPYSAKQVSRYIYYLTSYSEWLYVDTEQKTELLNPQIASSKSEYLMNMAAYHHRKNNSFYKHLKNDNQARQDAKTSYAVKLRDRANHNVTSPEHCFPSEITNDVIQGFTLPGSRSHDPIYKRLDLAKVLIFMLTRFGGVRISEPFHLYINDIQPHPSEERQMIIKIHHPSESVAPVKWAEQWVTREVYLRENFGLTPRHLKKSTGCYKAGWKNPALHKVAHGNKKTELFFYVEFLNASERELFYHLWFLYLKKQRPRNNYSPFAFLSKKTGMPLTMGAYDAKLKKVINKLGYEYSKAAGTTPHGCRHLFKAEAKARGISTQVIRELLHHKSLMSQEEYAKPSIEQVRQVMKEKENEMREKIQAQHNQLMDQLKLEVDNNGN
ncbi:phage integrase family protein [Shewanella baltica OS183]|uniref:gamma-mobile-trio recombinase GmtY n=1 Tax=Shewanella baltica TaxID=62322 RepID=UPI0001E109B1|nr:gamma-mobile-trio recombinase GmtY [Shewanella baltica]AEG09428.1 phage integrase family protein [Shewanella baltica BA175]EHQ17055.1 phage integrase family protein [Shewanella baltica OS183]